MLTKRMWHNMRDNGHPEDPYGTPTVELCMCSLKHIHCYSSNTSLHLVCKLRVRPQKTMSIKALGSGHRVKLPPLATPWVKRTNKTPLDPWVVSTKYHAAAYSCPTPHPGGMRRKVRKKDNTHQTESPSPHRFLSLTNQSDPVGRPERDEQLAQVEIAVLGVIFLTASMGNFILILVLWRRRRKLSRMYVFMLHLSIADLVVAFFQVLPQLIWDITDVFIGPDFLCRSIKYLQLLGMFASTYMIVVMTVDRYQAVCYPMVTFQKKRALWNIPICTSWSISLILSLPQVFIFSKTEISPGVFECWGEFIQPWGPRAYVTWIFVVIFFIPSAILITCQVNICRKIKRNMYVKNQNEYEVTNQKQVLPSRASNVNCISKAMIKTVKMTVVTVVAYVLCWSPFFIAQLWSVWFPSVVTEGSAFTIIMLLGNLNSCTNPWIYMYFCGHIPYCTNKQLENTSAKEESVITGSIHLVDRDPGENSTAA